MAKSLSSLWLKSVRRLSRAQQAQGRRLLLSLVPKPPRAPALRKAKPVKVAKARPIAVTRQSATSPARPLTGLPGHWQKSWFSVPAAGQVASARRMVYWLYLPSGAPAAPLPLVVMLHGCQQTATDFALSTRMNALAERKGFAVLYPQQSAAADAHRCWHWYKRATQEGLGDVRLIADMVAQVQAKHGLDRSRTYVVGLSAGAGLANILALRYPAMVAAVGLHSAPVFGTTDSPMSAYRAMQHGSGASHRDSVRFFGSAEQAFPGMPAILLHGARDSVVRRINMTQLTEQFTILNAGLITREEAVVRRYPARSTGRHPRHAYESATWYAGRKPQLVACEIDHLGHAWSGGDGSVEFSAPEGPDATLMMWTFFAQHWRLATPTPGFSTIQP
ncbi:MAG: PHB depolymerase family esterase [Polaromonas sp.]|uniref:extracellular catalytic domain type 1 short-chain-length polyhydroxyalkanoate depolymerase n=1 Tax=Polaromonas sp. TaxID=1869339 RepID=UPI0027348294|nr:PHB depolymerase family esterase [Polaromonas sp.]MDP2817064.1 PHB depolymerase family esterase [Polaromonas sp.]